MIIWQIITYISLMAFIVLIIRKIVRYANLPVHLRWELYPVAHESPDKNGGSYMQDLDWWNRPRRKSRVGELRFMAVELFLFRLYYRVNKKYWSWVYPFHLGIFSLIAWLFLLLIGSLVMLGNINIAAGSGNAWASVIYYLTLVTGAAGLSLTAVSTAGLLIKRIYNPDLKKYTAPQDYFNLGYILLIVLTGLVIWGLYDRQFSYGREFVRSLILFRPASGLNLLMYANILLVSLFLIYSPFTRMTHYVAKYFTFHKVQWDDTPVVNFNDADRRLGAALRQTPTWAGQHIQPDNTWEELSRENVPEKSLRVKQHDQ